MTLTAILMMLIVGLLLLIVEVFFIPGTGVIGIIGIMLLIGSIYMAFLYDNNWGWITLGAATVASGGVVFIGLRSDTWSKVTVHDVIGGQVKNDQFGVIQVGMVGTAVSRLAPSGKARFSEGVVEVTSLGEFIDEGTEVEVIKLESNRIIIQIKE